MKQLILSLFTLACASLSSFAQSSFTTQYPDSSTGWYIGQSSEFNVTNYIKNTTKEFIYIKWQVTASDITSGWKFKGFCDNRLCYGENAPGLLDGTEARVSFAYFPDEFGDFHALFDGSTALNNSFAWIELLAADTVNNDAKTLRFIARKGPLGTENVALATKIALFPNPARGYIQISWTSTLTVGGIQIINPLGQLLSSFVVTGNDIRIDISHLPQGLYYIRVTGAGGQVINMERFSHN